MKLKIPVSFWEVAGLGVLGGMRTSAAPFISSYILGKNQSKSLGRSPLRFMQSAMTVKIIALMALAEIVVDKLPSTPDRIKAGGVVGRSISGALAGAAVYKSGGKPPLTGALIGAVAASAATYASFYLRKAATKSAKLPDPITGAFEDALVIGTAIFLIDTVARMKR